MLTAHWSKYSGRAVQHLGYALCWPGGESGYCHFLSGEQVCKQSTYMCGVLCFNVSVLWWHITRPTFPDYFCINCLFKKNQYYWFYFTASIFKKLQFECYSSMAWPPHKYGAWFNKNNNLKWSTEFKQDAQCVSKTNYFLCVMCTCIYVFLSPKTEGELTQTLVVDNERKAEWKIVTVSDIHCLRA